MPDATLLEDLIAYVGFTDEDARALAQLGEPLSPSFERVVNDFYGAVERSPRAMAVFTGGKSQIERQKGFLRRWMQRLFSGSYDADYMAARSRIGQTHVRVGLDQRFMFTAMNLVRTGLHDALQGAEVPEELREAGHPAIDKILDLELAIMLETYSEDLLSKVREKDRLATLGQLAGFIGHELRNPLAVMDTSIHLLKRRLPDTDPRASRHLNRLAEQTALSSAIITDLLELTRDKDAQRDSVELHSLVTDAIRQVPGADVVQLSIDIQDGVHTVLVDPNQVRHMMANLVGNACQALAHQDGSRTVAISARREGGSLLVVVEDNGPGIDAEIRHRLFEPLATTRSKGLGLGLALCQRVAEKHGGSVSAENIPDSGARFVVRLAHAFEAET